MLIFSERLKKLRTNNGETQQDIANILNVQRTTIGEYERNKICPPIDKAKKLAEHFGVSVEYLMGYTDINNGKNQDPKPAIDISDAILEILNKLQDNKQPKVFNGKSLNSELRNILIADLNQILIVGKEVQKKNFV